MDYPRNSTGDALRRIARDGSDMTRPMKIDFHVAFSSRDSGEQFVALAANAGFETRLVKDDGEDPPAWTCWCSRMMLATHERITEMEQQLDDLARPLGGFIDGWGSFGNVELARRDQ
jgi:hypothetical protein